MVRIEMFQICLSKTTWAPAFLHLLPLYLRKGGPKVSRLRPYKGPQPSTFQPLQRSLIKAALKSKFQPPVLRLSIEAVWMYRRPGRGTTWTPQLRPSRAAVLLSRGWPPLLCRGKKTTSTAKAPAAHQQLCKEAPGMLGTKLLTLG